MQAIIQGGGKTQSAGGVILKKKGDKDGKGGDKDDKKEANSMEGFAHRLYLISV